MGFCRSCALRLAAAVMKHEDLSILDSDVIERRRKHRQSVGRQHCYVALIGGYMQVAVSVDPEKAVLKTPGSRLLFILNGHGPRVQRDIHHRLENSKAEEHGNNYFRLTTEVVDWLGEKQDTLLDLRETDN